MGNAALLLRDLGHEALGSDQAVYPPMSDLLSEAGIQIMEGIDAHRLAELNPDLVVIGNAFSRGNAEVEYLLDQRSIPFASLPETLSRFILSNRRNIVVTGTHGKTTTTALCSFLLEQAGTNPGYIIGGAPLDPSRGWASGEEGGAFVIEGDEYDSAFFDKRSKFIHYQPHIAIFNNLEFDHADIFRDLHDVKRTFEHFTRLIPKSGYALINGDDENLLSLFPLSWTTVYQIGLSQDCDLRIENYETTSNGSKFDLIWQGKRWMTVDWKMSGLFNARNAAMAILAAGLSAKGNDDLLSYSAPGIAAFRGVKRRQQVRFENDSLKIIEDFAHHPTAIKEMLATLRERFPEWELVAAFEPRSNTSRLEIMRAPMADALSVADRVIIGAAKRRSSENVEIMDTAALVQSLRQIGKEAEAFDSNENVLRRLNDLHPAEKRIVVFLTNGSFGGIIERFVDFHAARQIR